MSSIFLRKFNRLVFLKFKLISASENKALLALFAPALLSLLLFKSLEKILKL